MKNKLWKPIIGKVLVILMLFAFAQILVSAQESENRDLQNSSETSRRSIQGVWQTTVTQVNCQTGNAIRTFRGLLTFNTGGTIAETNAGSSPVLHSPGHGVWKSEDLESDDSEGAYSGAFIFLRFNPDGTFAGTQKITQSFQLDRRGNRFTSTGSIQIFDVNDNLIAMGCSTSTGIRFNLQ